MGSHKHCSYDSAGLTGLTPFSPRLWALPLEKAQVVLDLVGKACRTAWKPFRLVAFLPDDPAILKWTRKQRGVMALSVPRKRLPWVSPARWLRDCSYVARDMAWCQSPGLRVWWCGRTLPHPLSGQYCPKSQCPFVTFAGMNCVGEPMI